MAILGNLIKVPTTCIEKAAHGMLNAPLCQKLVHNTAVVAPIARFEVLNASVSPTTGLEWLAADLGKDLLNNILSPKPDIRFFCVRHADFANTR